MTGRRPQQQAWTAISARVLLAMALSSGMVPVTSLAGTNEQVVADWRSGIALAGVDPVAFFTDHAAKAGYSDIEAIYAGVTWRFCNEGNKAAFAANPEVYAPRFGGHDPVGVARGIARPGHPDFWVIAGERLYLFYSAEARAAFMAETEQSVQAAEEKWPQVLKTLSR